MLSFARQFSEMARKRLHRETPLVLALAESRRYDGGGVDVELIGVIAECPVWELVEMKVGACPRVDAQLQYQQTRHVHHDARFHLRSCTPHRNQVSSPTARHVCDTR